jgi:hypothetical protein
MADQAAAKAEINVKNIETFLNEYLGKKAPALPPNVKELIVKFAPWLTVIGVVISIPALLTLLGLGGLVAITAPLGGVSGVQSGFGYLVSMVFLVATIVLEGLAIPGLFAKTRQGWLMVFYSILVNALGSLLQFQIVGAVLGLIIGGYFIFQVREYYK